MKLLILSTCDNLIDGQQKALEDSLIKHGYDYELFLYGFIFGEQYKVIKIFVDQYQGDATHILYTDMFDTVALAPPSEVESKWKTINNKLLVESLTNPNDKEKRGLKMLISAEKACFPYAEDAVLYPPSNTPWQFVNGGGCMFDIEYFKELCNRQPFPDLNIMDPKWLMNCLLDNYEVKLDYDCQIFQTLAHSNQDEWTTEDNRIKNIATNTLPIFFHGNGRTDMQWVKDIATEQTI
jgi:hypothetical protein